MFTPTKPASEVYATVDGLGQPRGPDNGEVLVWAVEHDAAVDMLDDRINYLDKSLRQSIALKFSSALGEADPGPGTLRLNNAVQANAIFAYVDLLDVNNADITTALDAIPPNTFVTIFDDADHSKYLIFQVGSVTAGVGYRKIGLTPIEAGSDLSPLSAGADILLQWSVIPTSFYDLQDIETGVVPGFYGNGGVVARFEVDIYGRILGVSQQQINNVAGMGWPPTDFINRVPYIASPHTMAWAEMTGTGKAVFSDDAVLVNPIIGHGLAQSIKFAGSTSGYRTLKAPPIAGDDADFLLPLGTGATLATEPYVAGAVAAKTSLALSVQNSGNTNDSASGSGAYVAHNLSYTIPANYLTAGRALRILAHFRLTTGSAPPGLDLRLKIGGVVVAHVGSSVPAVSITNRQYAMQFYFQALAAPGASVNTETVVLCQLNAAGLGAAGACSDTAQPVALATNGTLAITLESQWSAPGTGTNQITLSQLIVEPIGA